MPDNQPEEFDIYSVLGGARLGVAEAMSGWRMPVEPEEPRGTTDMPKDWANETPIGEVSWSAMEQSSSENVPSLMPAYEWEWWLDLPMKECIDFYGAQIREAALTGNPARVDATRARLAKADIFFLLINICGRTDLIHPWLYERCREFQRDPNNHLDVWAREHFKSTVITFAGTLWEIIRNPEVTVGIFSHNKPMAKKFLGQIKSELENKATTFHRLWPDIFFANPKKEAPKWSEDDGITVKRKTNPKEATVEASGLVDGQPTGRHYVLRVYDDVVTMESVNTPDQIAKTTAGWEMSDNLSTEGGAVRYIGTRYHKFDTYHVMMEREVATPRIYPATKDGTETGEPVLMHPATLKAKRRSQGPYTFASQMLQNPLADSAMGFMVEWLRDHHVEISYEQAISSTNRIIIVDPSGGKQRSKDNDYTSMWVLGKAADGKWYILEIIRDRINLTKRASALLYLHRKWKPMKVGYEEYGMQADIEFIEKVQKDELYRFPIIPLGGRMSKNNRILRMVPYFERGEMCFPVSMMYKDASGIQVDLVKTFIEEEYSAFPVLAHDDMMDGLARFIDEEMEIPLPVESTIFVPRQFGLDASLHERAFGLGSSSGSMAQAASDWTTA